MNKVSTKILICFLAFFCFAVKAQVPSYNDSLKGFDYKEMEHHLVNFKGSAKERQARIELAKRRFIARKYYDNANTLALLNAARAANPSTQATCTNIDFEQGNTSGWTTSGSIAMTSGAGLDPFGNFPVVYPGGNFSMQLSDNNLSTTNFSSSASRVITVTPGNTFFNLHFALDILDYPHDSASAAALTIQFFDASNNLLTCPQYNCLYYEDLSGNPHNVGISNFQQTWGSSSAMTGPGVNLGGQNFPVSYAPWQTVALDLTAYSGTNITCVVTCKWCIYDYDWAYCYIDADCPTSNVSPPGTCLSLPANLCGPPGMATYNWTAPAGNSPASANTTCINATTAGVFTLNCTSNTTCTNTAYTYTYAVGPGPTAAFTSTVTPCSGNVNFTSTSTTNGGPPITTYTWSWGDGTANGAGATSSHSYAGVGTKTVTLYITNGSCIDSVKGVITIPAHPTPSFTNANNCLNSPSNFTSTSTAASGIASQIWHFGDATANGSGGTPTHTYASSGTFTVTLIVTDNSGCTDSIKQPITINPLPTITVNSPSTCNGGSATMTANGATTYAWSPGTGLSATTGSTVTANPPATTNYVITGTDVNGCVNTGTATVTVIANPAVTVNSPSICIGTPGTLTANGSTSYTWSPVTGLSATTGSTVSANPGVTTAYTIVGGVGTCTAVGTCTVTVNALPIITATSGTICVGQQTATLTAGGGVSYAWSPATGLSATIGTSVNATPGSTTNYVVTGTDANGCVNTANTSVTVNPLPVVSATGTTVCANATINLTSGGAATYTWTGPSAFSSNVQNPSIANSTTAMSGTYSVTATDANGCFKGNSTTVTVNALPIATATCNAPCVGTPLNLTSTGGTIWNWSGPNAYASALQNPTLAIAAVTMNGVYTVNVLDANNCAGTATVNITVNPLPIITANTSTICVSQQTATLTASGASTYVWAPATGLSSTIGTSVTGTPSVTLTYTITGTDANGCVNTGTTAVIVNPLPVVTVSGDTVCLNAAINLSAGGGNLYSWSGPNGFASNTQNPSIPSATGAMTGAYAVTVTDANGCVNGNVAQVLVNPFPNVSVSNLAICIGSAGNLVATGAVSYVWSPVTGLNGATGSIVGTNTNFNITYTVTGTDANGCSSSAVTTVTVNPLPVLAITPPTSSGCAPVCVTFSNTTTATGTYDWNFGDGSNSISAAPNHCFNGSGTFTPKLTLTDNNGCVNTATATVIVYPVPNADFIASPQPTSIYDPHIYYNDATSGAVVTTWAWTLGDPDSTTSSQQNTSFNYAAPGAYPVHLVVTTIHGCKDSTTKTIIIADEYSIYVPNAFSPNADGVNDIFFAKGEGIKDFKVYVFDRWGTQVFFSDDIYKGWDGRYQSKGTDIVQEDVYVWKIECKTFNGEHKMLKGTVSLIK